MRLALAAFPLWCTVAVLVFNTPWRLRLLVGGLWALSATRPDIGLLAVAAIVALGHYVEVGLGVQPFRISEAVVMAFFAGWLLPDRTDHDGPRVPGRAAWLLTILVCASVASQAWMASSFPETFGESLTTLYQGYYLVPDRLGFGAGARILEGLGLMAAAATLFRTRPRLADTLTIALVCSAVAAAATSLLLARGIAPAQILAEHAQVVVRTSAHVGDVNAAASYFAMMLFPALGMALRQRRRAAWWLAAAATQLAALWLAGSRTAEAVVVLGIAIGLVCYLSATWRPKSRGLALAVMLVLVIAAGVTRAWMLRADPGTSFRRQFVATSMRMIAARPVLGLGVGRYYDSSALFLSPEMAWTYAFQNAHNYFLQMAAELGLVGLVLFLSVIGTVIVRSVRAIARTPGDVRLLGCALGVGAMLTTCLTGHPLLLDEVAFPFWMLLGLVTALSGSTLIGAGVSSRKPDTPIGGRIGSAVASAAAVVAIVALAEIAQSRRPLQPSTSVEVTGLEGWESDGEGTQFRWTHDYASVFLPSNATRVYIPVRLPVSAPPLAPMAVDVEVGGIYKGQTLVGNEWAVLNVELPYGRPLQHFKRLDLKIRRTWQPAVYIAGSHDLRNVGVQVGQIKVFFEY